jgi:2-keto-4-pentenoate hydratase/2-oxohepta-3-ene-1,7-dioic acid hydratase in catechol pathway
MTSLYRLAVIRTADGPLAVAEQGGRMAPLHALLGEATPRTDLGPLLADWSATSARIDAAVDAGGGIFAEAGIDAANADFALPFASPGALMCIGANYHDHVAEMPIPMTPEYPYAFVKPTHNTICASGEPVEAPKGVAMMDFEAELAAVIGVTAKHIGEDDALAHVAGYINFNDLSARDWVASRPAIGVDWVRHKAHDGFAPIGPYFVPARFVADPQDLPIRLSVNGTVKQDSSTGQMIYGLKAIIRHLSSIMTLRPGDIIATGTPAGVGHGRKPPEYLKPGDEIRMEIGPLGELVTPII